MVPALDRLERWSASVVLSLAFVCSPLLASWEYIPQEVRMIEADIVVAGEIVKSGKNMKKHGQVFEVGIIKPLQLLKGNPGPREQIRLAWPQIGPRLHAPQVGDRSIWILRADETLPVYRATYVLDRQPLEKLDEVRARLSTIESIHWSEPEDGLQIGIFTEQRETAAATRLSVYPLLKNVTHEPIFVNTLSQDMPFSILSFAPDGRPMDVPTYGAALTGPASPRRQHFLRIPPGGVRSAPHGFVLPILTEGGEYSIRMRYKSYREAPELKLGNIWTGALASPTIAVQVPEIKHGEL
jgi:hypothetical protein